MDGSAPPGHLLIRADGSTDIGGGHLLRTLALAQAWRDVGGSVGYVCASTMPGFPERLAAEQVALASIEEVPGSVADAAAVVRRAAAQGARYLVVDGYVFDEGYHRTVKQLGLALTVIDDHGHPAPCAADLVVNQNIYAEPALYPGIPAHRLLLGLRHALLRREYRSTPPRKARTAGEPLRILVTMGAGDRPNATLKVLRGLALLTPGSVEVVVLAGPANPYRATWAQAAAGAAVPVRIEESVTDLTPLLGWADLAISAAGTTTWELARTGVPACLVVLAENQRAVAEAAARAGVAIDLGWHADLDVRRLARAVADLAGDEARSDAMSARGQALIDGQGAQRVAAAIARLTAPKLG